MNTKLQFRRLTISLTLLLAGCTTPGSQEQGEASSADVTQAGDATADAPQTDAVAESTASAEGAVPESSTTEAAPADAGTLTDAQTPTTDPATAGSEATGTATTPGATSAADGLAATDGKTPDAAAATSSTETPASATIPDAGSDATADASGTAAAAAAAGGVVAGADAAATATGEALTQEGGAAETPANDAEASTQEASNPTAASEAAPAVMKPAESNTMEATIDRDQQRRDYTFGTRLFGSSRMQLAVNHPKFNEEQKGYETLYGKEKDYPTFTIDWFPADWWVNPGLSASIGGYTVTGMAAIKGGDPNTIVADPNSQTTLLFVPLQASFKVEMTPFRKKWIVFDGWFGYEYGWWQETTSTASSVPSLFGAMASGSSSSTDSSKPTSKGVKSATVFGASAHILLNSLDERTVRSMIATMGLSHVYLTPFFETVKTINKSGLTFGRNIYGLGFTFESLR